MADTVATTDLQTAIEELETQIKTFIENEEIAFAQEVKEYVEGRLEELQTQLLDSNKWSETKTAIDAILEVFDANKDGELSPEEILAKFAELKVLVDKNTQAIEELNNKIDEVSSNLTTTETKLEGQIAQSSVNVLVITKQVFSTAVSTIENRMAKVREIFGLDNTNNGANESVSDINNDADNANSDTSSDNVNNDSTDNGSNESTSDTSGDANGDTITTDTDGDGAVI